MIFVKPAVRKSLLAKMLGEILDTRVMIKYAMKGSRNDKVRLFRGQLIRSWRYACADHLFQSLTSLLNARQLGLKLMAVSAPDVW